VLRKDFIVDEYQIYEAKLHRANAILLIAAAITKAECLRFTEIARQLELDVLLELHDEREIEYIAPQHNLIGVNNRNLGSFVTTVDKSFEMAELLPKMRCWSPKAVFPIRKPFGNCDRWAIADFSSARIL